VGIEEDVIGFITHWIDFKNLWEIYKNRGVKEEEECLIYWTRNHYTKFMSKVLSFMMLKLVVMVCKKGTYESCPEGFGLENDRELMVNVYGLVPTIWRVPDVMSKNKTHSSKSGDHFLETDDYGNSDVEKLQRKVEDIRQQLETLEDPDKLCSFGDMAFDGDGVEQDFVEAANWYKMAAEKGHAIAQHNLAIMYEKGQGVPQDFEEAAKWYRMAADQGKAGSQNNLGILYESGHGVPQDNMIALDLYREAAKCGDETVLSNLKRFEAKMNKKRYQEIVDAYGEFLREHTCLIGDCSLLPLPKNQILYAQSWMMREYEKNRDETNNKEHQKLYDNQLSLLKVLFSLLARDWQEIDPADKEAVAKLARYWQDDDPSQNEAKDFLARYCQGDETLDKEAITKLRNCESFPQWALPLIQKYCDNDRASELASEISWQVKLDRMKQEKTNG